MKSKTSLHDHMAEGQKRSNPEVKRIWYNEQNYDIND